MTELSSTLIIENIFNAPQKKSAKEWVPLNTGVDICYIYKDESTGAAAAYVRYAPGTSVKQHKHLGYEHVIVLEGEQSDDEHSYTEGCLAVQPPKSVHTIRSDGGCTVLAIWSAPLKFE